MHKSKVIIISGLLILLFSAIKAQEVPIPPNHLINHFIDRHITLGHLSQSDIGVRPYTYITVRKMLAALSAKEIELNGTDNKLLKRFYSEFSIKSLPDKISLPWQRSSIKRTLGESISTFDLKDTEPHFVAYRDSNVFAWATARETFRFRTIEEKLYRHSTDQFSIIGSLSDRLSFYIDFTMNRFVGDSALVYQIHKFKNEDHPYFDVINSTLWYQSEAAFHIKTDFGNFQVSKVPLIWGLSPQHSPILSNSVQPIPTVNYSFAYKNIRFNFINGALLARPSDVMHKQKEFPEKFIVAHRLEFDINKNLTVSFNEMAIYGDRSFVIEYLIPINFLWPAEHNLGDRDNVLMAFDCYWRIKPGIVWYNTFVWDEMKWENVFKKWWGNKYVFQSGLHWTSANIFLNPDIRIELSYSRPWTYTHDDVVSSYTSANIGLGLPQGPNSQSLFVSGGFWPSYRWHVQLSTLLMKKGVDLGSHPDDSYNLRDIDLDFNTPFLLGTIEKTVLLKLETQFAINRIVNIFGTIGIEYPKSEIIGLLGLTLDW